MTDNKCSPGSVEAAMQECADIATRYNDCGGDFIAEKIRDRILSLQSATPTAFFETEEEAAEAADNGRNTGGKSYYRPATPTGGEPFKDGDPVVTALIWEVDRAVKQAARDGGKYETTIRQILNDHLRDAAQAAPDREAVARLIRGAKIQIDEQWEGTTAYVTGPESLRAADAILALSSTTRETPPTPKPTPWPVKGDRMKFLGRNGYPSELEAAMKIFTVGNDYIVVDCDVQDWSHSIQFVGVKGRFNGVMFERVALTSPERGCICQDQHRRGYCTEPGCSLATPDRGTK